ncbi:hypothetical protein D8674_008043 [Pyrus ussuriensis x Pyrus communis]|uniref:Myb-like domain-containing protein n=1 Tax=Pyrus ussuriensis x Pyrus communis TaxID=2448454 RepID=A0A5N5I4J9_9ROSA|nr:hypothetical protein D8674_008043 [Pyrus ussuriensis x Pyrus communis]
MKGRAWTRKEDETLCRAYRWVSKDSVKGSSQTSKGVWTRILNKWHKTLLTAANRHESGTNYYNKVRQAEELYMEDNSKSFNHHDGSPTIQETRVENPSPGEGSIPRAMGRNKARKLKEKGKANDGYTFQQEMVASLRLMAEQNVIAAEERNHRHEERAKQIQEEMDDRNMPILIGKRGKLWPDESCLTPTIILQWQMMMMMIIDFM